MVIVLKILLTMTRVVTIVNKNKATSNNKHKSMIMYLDPLGRTPNSHGVQVVLVGDATVGKTHLLSRYVKSKLPKAGSLTGGSPKSAYYRCPRKLPSVGPVFLR